MTTERVAPVTRDPGAGVAEVAPATAEAPAIPKQTGEAGELHASLLVLRGHLGTRMANVDVATKPRIAAIITKIDAAITTIPSDLARAKVVAAAANHDCDSIMGPVGPAEVHTDGVDRATVPHDRTMADLSARMDRIERDKAAEEDKKAEEARKPGFFRTLLEVLETIGRWFLPVVNLVSACVRLFKWLYIGFTKGFDKIDWKDEAIRMAGDIAGIFFPPVGAITNATMNIVDPMQMFEKDGRKRGQSQILGGINPEVFNPLELLKDDSKFLKIKTDDGLLDGLIDVSPNDKDNWFRGAAHDVADGVASVFKGGAEFVTQEREPSQGGVDYRPIDPRPAAEPVPVRG